MFIEPVLCARLCGRHYYIVILQRQRGGAVRVERRGWRNMLGGGLLAQPGDLEGIHLGRNLG